MPSNRRILRVILAAALAGVGVACKHLPGDGSPPTPAVQPVLGAVLRSGTPLVFARRTQAGAGFEVLPSRAAILRLTNPYPGSSDRIRVTLTPAGGTARQLDWVGQDDIPGKQARDQTGYYEIVIDNTGYSLIMTAAPAERSGPGYSLEIVNLAADPSLPASPPLKVGIEPRSTVAAPSSVFFDCGNDHDSADGRWHYNCKPGASIVTRQITLQGWLVGPGHNCLGELCVEDFHYDFFPDPDFVAEYYGR
ncbi:MAG TPA: hypothetical protein VIG99_09080, partial [Myxococcaceae bacterium]